MTQLCIIVATVETVVLGDVDNNSIQYLIYLRVHSKAQRPIVKLARVRRQKEKQTNRTQNKATCVLQTVTTQLV